MEIEERRERKEISYVENESCLFTFHLHQTGVSRARFKKLKHARQKNNKTIFSRAL